MKKTIEQIVYTLEKLRSSADNYIHLNRADEAKGIQKVISELYKIDTLVEIKNEIVEKHKLKTIDWSELLNTAIRIAQTAHNGQVDKGGNPYILHPLAVMNRVDKIEEKIVAVLHDVIEDTLIDESILSQYFPDLIIDGVLSVTRRKNEIYKDFIQRCKKNELGRRVKIADIKENMDLNRLPEPTKSDVDRIEERYKPALMVLEG